MTEVCARNTHSICKLDGMVCQEPCAQFLSFDPDLYSDLTSQMSAQEKKNSKAPKSTFYEILRGSKSTAALQQGVNCNRELNQRLLTVEQRNALDKEKDRVDTIEEEKGKWGF